MLGVLFGLVVPSISSLSAKAAGATKGGQIYVEPEAEFSIDGGKISGGEAVYGGAVYISDNATLEMSGGDIYSNSATYGGAIAMGTDSVVNVSNGKIRDNTGTYGGGIYNNGGTLNVTGGTFSGNEGTDIYNEAGTLVLKGGTFSGEIYNNGTLDYYNATLNEGAKLKLNAPINIKAVPTEALTIELTETLTPIGSTIANIDTEIASSFSLEKLNITNIPAHTELKLEGEEVKLVASKVTITITVNSEDMGSVDNETFKVDYGSSWTVSGTTITFTGGTSVTATPADTTTAQNFSFDRWTDLATSKALENSGTVTGDMNIRADFTGVARNYTVTFKVDETANYGIVAPTQLTVPYGTKWTVKDNVLTLGETKVTATPKERDDQYTYKFVSWSANAGTVTGPTTITATFGKDVNNYTVTITSNNDLWGTVDKGTVSVPYGSKWSTSGDKLTFSNGSSEVVTAIPNDGDAHYGYEVELWSPAEGTVTEATKITVTFKQTIKTYTITINVSPDGYGTVTQSTVANVPYGTAWSVKGNVLTISTSVPVTITATETKQTDEFAYSFTGWDNEEGTVDGDETITANFTRSVRNYDVTFVITPTGYGTVSATGNKITVPYGTTWKNSGATLTFTKPSSGGTETVTATQKVADKQYTYKFDNWGTPSGTVRGAVSINVNFTRTLNEYDVTFVIKEPSYGSVSAEDNKITVPYGTTWTNSTNTLTFTKPNSLGTVTVTAKPADTTSEFSYSFTSWSLASGEVEDTTSITVTFTQTRRNYDVTFAIVESGWGSVNNVDSQNKISLPYGTTWATNKNVLTFTKPASGGTVAITATPTPAGPQYSYEFGSWVADAGTVQSNTTIQVNFKQSIVTYTVTIEVDDSTRGTLTATTVENVPYGTTVKVDSTGVNKLNVNGTIVTATAKEQTPQYTYSFKNWTIPNSGKVTGAMTVTANFNATLRNYTLSFTSSNASYGTVDTNQIASVPYGTSWSTDGAKFTLSLSPAKTVTASPVTTNPQYSFKFTKWRNSTTSTDLGASGKVEGNMTISATFEIEATKTYTVTIIANDYGTLSDYTITGVPYGTTWSSSGNVLTINTATRQTVTATPNNLQEEYIDTFTGYTPPSGKVEGNTEIYANFSHELKIFTITITVNNSGYGSVDVGSVEDVAYGTLITFSGKELKVGSTTITASIARPTYEYEYSFSKWYNVTDSKDLISGTVNKDLTIRADFTQSTRNYTVTITVNSSTYGSVSRSSISVPYGTAYSTSGSTLTIGSTDIIATPKDPSDTQVFSFTSWSCSDSGTITGATTITATFSASTRYYTVTIITSGSGSVNRNSMSVTYNTSYSTSGNILTIGSTDITATPTPASNTTIYSFSSWSCASSGNITGNMTITANFTSSTRYYTVTITTSGSGSVSQSSVSVTYNTAYSTSGSTLTIGSTEITATPSASTNTTTYSFSSWSCASSGNVTSDMTITARFTSSTRTYNVYFQVSSSYGYGGTITTKDSTSYDYETYNATVNLSSAKVTLSYRSSDPWWAQANAPASDDNYTYSFKGWSTSSTSSTTITSYTITSNVTFYAVFTRSTRSYYVYFRASSTYGYGSVSSTAGISCSYGTTISLSSSSVSVGGYTRTATANSADDDYSSYGFVGWSTSSTSNGTTTSVTVTGTTYIYAVFSRTARASYTVSFSSSNTSYGNWSSTTSLTVKSGTTYSFSVATGTLSLNKPVSKSLIETRTVKATAATSTYYYYCTVVIERYSSGTSTGTSGTITRTCTIEAYMNRTGSIAISISCPNTLSYSSISGFNITTTSMTPGTTRTVYVPGGVTVTSSTSNPAYIEFKYIGVVVLRINVSYGPSIKAWYLNGSGVSSPLYSGGTLIAVY